MIEKIIIIEYVTMFPDDIYDIILKFSDIPTQKNLGLTCKIIHEMSKRHLATSRYRVSDVSCMILGFMLTEEERNSWYSWTVGYSIRLKGEELRIDLPRYGKRHFKHIVGDNLPLKPLYRLKAKGISYRKYNITIHDALKLIRTFLYRCLDDYRLGGYCHVIYDYID